MSRYKVQKRFRKGSERFREGSEKVQRRFREGSEKVQGSRGSVRNSVCEA
jgi:hypothetical protein